MNNNGRTIAYVAQTYEAMEALRLSKRGTQGTGRGVPWTG